MYSETVEYRILYISDRQLGDFTGIRSWSQNLLVLVKNVKPEIRGKACSPRKFKS